MPKPLAFSVKLTYNEFKLKKTPKQENRKMKTETIHLKHQTVTITRADLRHFIKTGVWKTLVDNFKAMKKFNGMTITIHRV